MVNGLSSCFQQYCNLWLLGWMVLWSLESVFPFSHLCVKRLDVVFEPRLFPQLTGVRALFWRCLVAHSLFLYKRLFLLISFILFFPVLLGVVDFTIVFLSLVQIVFKLMFISLVCIPLYLFFVYLKQLCVFFVVSILIVCVCWGFVSPHQTVWEFRRDYELVVQELPSNRLSCQARHYLGTISFQQRYLEIIAIRNVLQPRGTRSAGY